MIIHFASIVLSLLLAAYIVPGVVIQGLYSAVIVALLLVVTNVTLKPLLKILTLPITILTLGLFSFVINAAIFLFLASFIEGFAVSGFMAALVGSTIVALGAAVGGSLK